MVKTFLAEEITADAGVSKDRLAWLISIGVVKPERPGEFRPGDVFRAKVVKALLDAGLPEALLEEAVAKGWLDLDHVDEYLPPEQAHRSSRTFADFVASSGPTASHLPALYEILGLPRPDPSAPIHVDEEAMFKRLLDGWRLASDDALFRAARLLGEGTRNVAIGWTELLDEQMGRPARDRMFSGEIDRFPREVAYAAAALVNLAPDMFRWLNYRYVEQAFMASLVEGIERFLATRDVVPMPQPQPPPAIVFVDLSGFTRLAEERGDQVAVLTAMSLQRDANTVAGRRGGRLVKLLGDGALLQFSEVKASVDAALDLVETIAAGGSVSAHAGIHTGPVIERDLDIFGRSVNLASRIAAVARRGEVLASQAVMEAVEVPSVHFERVDQRTLKGIAEPVTLFRVTRGEHRPTDESAVRSASWPGSPNPACESPPGSA